MAFRMASVSTWVCALGLLALTASAGAGDGGRVTADRSFGDWRMECAVGAGALRKGCAIWVGPIRARGLGDDETRFTLFVDPVTSFASIATRHALFVQFKVDGERGLFADCDNLGLCEVSKADARVLFQQMYSGAKLTIRIARSAGTCDRILDLAGYRSALDTYLSEERIYELKDGD